MRTTWHLAAVAFVAASWLSGCGTQSAEHAAGPESGGRVGRTPATAPDTSTLRRAAPPSKADLADVASLESVDAMAEPAGPAAESARTESPREDRHFECNLQSGTLTAGSFDDVDNFSDYRQFVSKAMQQDAGEILPRWALGERVMIQVVTPDGEPVTDARVTVRPAANQAGRSNDAAALLDLPTASDGRVMFLTGMDGAAPGGEYLVTVVPPHGGAPASRTMRLEQQPWQVVLPGASAQLPTMLDLALVIDTTGSMGDELEYLKVEIESIARAVHEMFPNVHQRYALILYRDEGDLYVTRVFDFTPSLTEFHAKLAEQSAAGGGDYPEAMHLALERAGALSWRDRETARVLFLVADAPPHDRYAERTLDAVRVLRRHGVRIYPVACSGVDVKAEFVMRAASFLTLGQYLFLTDHSGVGNPHAKPHVPEYQVERLDRLMVRMIAAELSGRRLAPDQVIAIEQGEDVVPQPVPQRHPQPEQLPQGAASAHRLPGRRQAGLRGPMRAALEATPRWAVFLALVAGACVLDAVTSRAAERTVPNRPPNAAGGRSGHDAAVKPCS